MRQKSMSRKDPAEKAIRDIRRKTRRKHSKDEKIRIVLEGLRGEESIAAQCRREGIPESLYYNWSKEFLEAGKKRLADDTKANMLQSVNESLLDFIKTNIPGDIGAEACIAEGSVYSAILKTAKKMNSDLIIIGSHRPTMGDFLLGPNAARVVRHAECSVLVVRN